MESSSAVSGDQVYRKVTRRLIPFLIICYFFAYLDRVNVGFAKLYMQDALSFSDTVYGLGAGVFFIGYFIFELPSNLLLQRYGPRFWIARIMASWAILSALMMFVTTPTQFYVLRFLLGVAEAGFFPGIVFYLTFWFPSWRAARTLGLFILVTPLSTIIGSPLSGLILKLFDGVWHLHNWQWLFLIEAIPSLLLAGVVLRYLDNDVKSARWLSDAEKQVIIDDLALDEARRQQAAHGKVTSGVRDMLANGYVWLLAVVFFSFNIGYYGINFWLPSIIKSSGVTDDLNIGLLAALPYVFGAIFMVLNSRHSDTTQERRWHIAIPAVIGCVGLALSAWSSGSTFWMMAWICLAMSGTLALIPTYISLPGAMLSGTAAAAGIALVNSVGNLAGFFGPTVLGWLNDTTGRIDTGLYILAGFLLLCAPLILMLPARLANPAPHNAPAPQSDSLPAAQSRPSHQE
ncbi:MFS transporter [Shimwellia blattae]|uniref:Inner membrane transport protein YfaV n=1 Tax=Shimwellia blattae (strain ATCC 29907 / DSM 4481 / JCM 1650 / NBRC 105725 / CDC 9005-74) TaxID=630626 RepID=I2BCY5_SHIBC|nr:MFS transporter [Shimwellia blattae]AFJ48389.1 inner membrane transport protein YfaV [Shimwellia blattae DSM 4481 = NBRC 105725]GAB81083.1 major facilitator superfamily transporter RhmT [Shimwellia blattae DSM 4481 = NBRC 105725]VDY65882.1 Inner membrane transport protein RhmT [Shimwellia blattae]VEC26142.1 Inner membrane transport protein RhmT [Shimwellia blattae]